MADVVLEMRSLMTMLHRRFRGRDLDEGAQFLCDARTQSGR
jgi:hypothetical protein